MTWRLAVLRAAERLIDLGQHECVRRLMAAGTAAEGMDAAERAESAAKAVLDAAKALRRRGYRTPEVRFLVAAADRARRAALGARVECLLALAPGAT